MKIHKDYLFLIVGDHPHEDELCYMVGETEDTITTLGEKYLVQLKNCEHGVDQCYVNKENLKLIERMTIV